MSGVERVGAAARRIPCVSLLLGLLALAGYWIPAAAGAFEYNTVAIAAGQLWRIVTCHVAHWSFDHLFWDVGSLLVLGAICELRDRRALMWCIGASAVAIPAAVWILMPDLETYRGLSGIDSALFVLLAVSMLRESLTDGDHRWAALCGAVLIGFAGKIAYELLSGGTLFVDSATSNMIPVPLAHVVGGIVGAACGVWFRAKDRRAMLVSRQSSAVSVLANGNSNRFVAPHHPTA